jgi:hypothetical protein
LKTCDKIFVDVGLLKIENKWQEIRTVVIEAIRLLTTTHAVAGGAHIHYGGKKLH